MKRKIIRQGNEPTDISEVKNLKQIIGAAIAGDTSIKLEDLPMVPWTRTLPCSSSYPMKNPKSWEHFPFVSDTIVPQILGDVCYRIRLDKKGSWDEHLEFAIEEVFKNAYEQAAKVGAPGIKIEHTPLGQLPMEILVLCQTKEIFPYFAMYWKYQKDFAQKNDGRANLNFSFYTFARKHNFGDKVCSDVSKGQGNQGYGLINMINHFNDCNFYKTQENELVCYVKFDGKNKYK